MTAWEYLVLGPLEVRHAGAPVALGGPKQRGVLASLLLDAGRVVPTSRIVEHVWDAEAGDSSLGSLQAYVSTLRRVLRDEGDQGDGRIEYVRPGYRVHVSPGELDLEQLDDAQGRAREARARGDLAAAAHLLRYALSLSRGPVLADLVDNPSFAPLVVPVERRVAALRHECYDVELVLGRHHALGPELEAASALDPLDERLAGQLMLALYRSGRQADALAVYQRVSDRLRDELGLEPGAALRGLHEGVLRQELALEAHDPAADVAATMTHDDRGVRGATLVLPNGVPIDLGSRTVVVGRHPECDVVLADPRVSRRHAEIRPVAGGYEVVDLGSSNGTRVGGDEVSRRRLADGDRIQVGSSELVLALPEPVGEPH